jgi:hypothetical protein
MEQLKFRQRGQVRVQAVELAGVRRSRVALLHEPALRVLRLAARSHHPTVLLQLMEQAFLEYLSDVLLQKQPEP